MNNTLTCVLAFASGATVGAVVSWGLLKTKYEQIAQEEIDSVKEMYSASQEKNDICEEETVPEESDNSTEEYEEILDSEGYTNYSNINTKKGGTDIMNDKKPYVIPPEECGELEDYDVETLTFYADGILVDDQEEIIEDIDGLVGYESLKTFGQYEDDAVHVRNDALKTDYEILLDVRNYYDVMDNSPQDEDD